MSFDNWRTQLRKGFLDLCILNCLDGRERYGYDLIQTLKRYNGTAIREGIIYPILARMQSAGLVSSEKRYSSDGPPRKYYHLTPEGKAVLQDMNSHWQEMVRVMAQIRKLNHREDSDDG